MKRIISTILALTMVITLLPMNIMAEEAVFSDVTVTDYYAEAATALEALSVLAGYPDGTFGAERSITRAEMAAIVCRMIEKEEDAEKAKENKVFDDVAADHWASGYIYVASEEGIINGDGDGNFRPEDDVLYEEAIKMVVCALGMDDEIEVDENDWSAGYLKAAEEKGISDNLKGTKGVAATRGDIAVMGYNALTMDLAAPTASLKEGSYTGSKSVSLKTETKDAEIYYTLDGTAPTVESTKYTKAITIAKSCTLKAVAVVKGVLVSDVMSTDYTISHTGGGGGSSRPSTYIVSFDLNYEGATGAPESQEVKSGETAIMPEEPTRDGFIFLGWSTDKNEEILFDFSEDVTGSLTLYALWANGSNDDSYNVTFILNDGSEGAYEMQVISAYDRATIPEDPERILYTFTGWYTEEEAINEYDFSSRVTEDIILYAGWGAPDGEKALYAATSGGGTVYSVTGIEMLEGQVSVTLNANEECTLVVKFLDEESEEIITTVSAQTPTYCEMVPVVIPVDYDLPEHYLIVADLYDDYSEKLCDAFRSIEYTSAFEEFDKQTVNDFDEELVINFDEDETENFGVLNEEVIQIDSTQDTNTLTVETQLMLPEEAEEDFEERIYVFANTTEEVENLSAGDRVYIEGTSYLFKVGSVQEEGETIIVTESDDVELSDFYSVLKVDMDADSLSTYRSDSDVSASLGSINEAVSLSFAVNDSINWEPKKDRIEAEIGASGSGKIEIKITYDPKWFADDYFFMSVVTDLDLTVKAAVEFKINNDDDAENATTTKEIKEIKIGKITIPTPIPGLTVSVKPSVPVEWEFAGSVNFEFSSKMESGFTYSSYDGKQTVDKKERTVKIGAEGKASVKFGPKITLSVEFCKEVLKVALSAGAGIKAEAEIRLGYEGLDPEAKHACTLCIKGTAGWYAEVNATISCRIIKDVLEWKIVDWDIVKVEGDFPRSPNFYLSLINHEDSILQGRIKFDFGDCPNEIYRTNFIVKDEDGNELSGVNISVNNQNGRISKEDSSPCSVYLYDGVYAVSAVIENRNVSKTVVVSGAAQEIELSPDSADGSIAGKVCDAETNNPISDAVVLIEQNGLMITSVATRSDGSYEVDLADGTYSVEVTKDGYIPFKEYASVSNGVTNYLQTTLLIPGDRNAKGGFEGRIVDDVTGYPIEGVTLRLREGWNNSGDGDVIETLTTDEDGFFLYDIKKVFGVPVRLDVGNYTLTAQKDGYSTTSFNIIVVPNIIVVNQNASMSPIMEEGEYRIVLRWGANPRDLDSHLVGPTASGGRFHTWYGGKTFYENGELAVDLDLDDVDGEGPETTTIHCAQEGKYYFYIHHFAGSGSIATSSAQVIVYKGDREIATYNAPSNLEDGLYWNVFVLDAVQNTITPVNTITGQPNVSYSYSEIPNSTDEVLSLIMQDVSNTAKE